jgi:hypothetical protein
MRPFLTTATTIALLVFAVSTFAATKPSCAGTIINACGKFSFSVPDDWKESKEDVDLGVEHTAFENRDGSLYVVAGPLRDKTATLTDEDVHDFLDEQFDRMKVTSDKKDMLGKLQIRLLEGTGTDDGDPVVFRALALDTGTAVGVLIVVVSGAARVMDQGDNKAAIEKILRSIRPH